MRWRLKRVQCWQAPANLHSNYFLTSVALLVQMQNLIVCQGHYHSVTVQDAGCTSIIKKRQRNQSVFDRWHQNPKHESNKAVLVLLGRFWILAPQWNLKEKFAVICKSQPSGLLDLGKHKDGHSFTKRAFQKNEKSRKDVSFLIFKLHIIITNQVLNL